ncbi:CT20 family protein [Apiospora aurea]|uniref:CT20 family protein n=1 Tax=Apiospora aurea TaxID=335848 RepID=A0ABR1QLP0_9PEZI
MPPKRKGRASLASNSTPKTPTPLPDDSAMDVDTPHDADTPRAADTPVATQPSQPMPSDAWTDDQVASLLKAIIRWKPTGMHKHFRVIAISEMLRNHGIKPEVHPHTRIPGIWAKLGQLYNLAAIDERDNSYAFNEDDPKEPWKNYKDFDLPAELQEPMFARRLRAPSEAPSSPPQFDFEEALKGGATSAPGARDKKRKRRATDAESSAAGSGIKTRSSTVEDTEDDTPLPSSPVTKSARGARSQRRSARHAKADSTEPEANEESEGEDQEDHEDEEDEEEEDDEEDENGDEEEQEESGAEEAATPASSVTRSTRGGARGRGGAKAKAASTRGARRGRGRARGRGRG